MRHAELCDYRRLVRSSMLVPLAEFADIDVFNEAFGREPSRCIMRRATRWPSRCAAARRPAAISLRTIRWSRPFLHD